MTKMAITKIISSIFGKYPFMGIKNQSVLCLFANANFYFIQVPRQSKVKIVNLVLVVLGDEFQISSSL
tara:strand:- start:234 stop:437 length:204 start_codon:yes stop_codon:yes gene_type:complete